MNWHEELRYDVHCVVVMNCSSSLICLECGCLQIALSPHPSTLFFLLSTCPSVPITYPSKAIHSRYSPTSFISQQSVYQLYQFNQFITKCLCVSRQLVVTSSFLYLACIPHIPQQHCTLPEAAATTTESSTKTQQT